MKAYYGPFKGSITPMIDLGMYIFKCLNKVKLNLKNDLTMLTSKNYMSQNMYVLPQNNCVLY